MSLRQLESGIVSPTVGFLLDRFSARKLIFWSAVISGVGFIGLGFITGIVTFFLCFVVISLGASGVSHAVTWPVIISRWFRRNRGLATGLAVTGPIFGSPLVILNTQIEEAYGWRAVLFGYGTLVLVGVTLLSMGGSSIRTSPVTPRSITATAPRSFPRSISRTDACGSTGSITVTHFRRSGYWLVRSATQLL